jgi:hypothetical protein
MSSSTSAGSPGPASPVGLIDHVPPVMHFAGSDHCGDGFVVMLLGILLASNCPLVEKLNKAPPVPSQLPMSAELVAAMGSGPQRGVLTHRSAALHRYGPPIAASATHAVTDSAMKPQRSSLMTPKAPVQPRFQLDLRAWASPLIIPLEKTISHAGFKEIFGSRLPLPKSQPSLTTAIDGRFTGLHPGDRRRPPLRREPLGKPRCCKTNV